MPILLPADYQYPLPQLYPVRQSFPRPCLEDVAAAVRGQLAREEIAGLLRPGQRVAVAVGSRGIRHLSLIVATVVEELKAAGTRPFVVSAMGSHGNGTPEGQREILSGYGVTEEALGAPVITGQEVEEVGRLSNGRPIYFDSAALHADLIVPINRVKLHTDFVADIQSGIIKMLAIGLGNHQGCSSLHEEEFSHFGAALKEAARLILAAAPVGFGLAIVENAYDETALVEAIPAESLLQREPQLVQIAKENMPTLMIPDIDVLIVEAIGKDISGAGYDPNILGRSYLLDRFVLPTPAIGKMVLLDLTPASHGNGIGLGAFDVITRRVFEQLDLESIYANGVAVKCLEDCKIPLIAADKEEALRIAIKCLRGADRQRLKIVKITDTLHLEKIWVSAALLDMVERNPRLELL